jgi:hypothetical protein
MINPLQLEQIQLSKLVDVMCVVDHGLVSHIEPKELLQLRRNKWTTLYRCKLHVAIDTFNGRSKYFIKWVCDADDIGIAKRRLLFLVNLGHYLLKAKDLFGASCVYSALKSNAVFRLRPVWSSLSRKSRLRYTQLSNLCGLRSEVYSEELSKLHRASQPFVPMLHIMCKHVTQCKELIKQFYATAESKVNIPWYLMRKLHHQVDLLLQVKATPYPTALTSESQIDIEETVHKMQYNSDDVEESSWCASLNLYSRPIANTSQGKRKMLRKQTSSPFL